jgi:outer membrane lipoprotein-sorting protein
MKNLICLILISFFALNSTLASLETVKQSTASYAEAPYVHIKFKQKQLMELLRETKKSTGELFYSNKKMRIELKGEQNSTTLLTPGVITTVLYDTKRKPIQILTSKPTPHPLLDLLFGQKEKWDNFKITSTEIDTESVLQMTLEPKIPKNFPGLTKLSINLNKNKKQISKLIYWDDLDNSTTYEFTFQKIKDKIDGSKFILVPPKGLEVKSF